MKDLILVTGGMGYIGSHTIIELLRHTSYDVASIDNLCNSSDVTNAIEQITDKRVLNYAVNLCDYDASVNVLSQIVANGYRLAGVIHFAALKSVPDSVAEPLLYYDNNIGSLSTIMKCCEQFNIPHLIFSSSCSVYGNVSQLPVKEDTALGYAESPYAYTKQIGERMLKDWSAGATTKVLALRYFNPVGADHTGQNGENPRNPPTALVPIITQVAAGLRASLTVHGTDYATRDGSCVRDYIHVTDLAEAHILGIQYLERTNEAPAFDVINIGTGNGVTVLEAIKAFEDVTQSPLNYKLGPRREGDVAAIYSDSEKAERLLKWQAKHSIADMMRSAWAWQCNLKA